VNKKYLIVIIFLSLALVASLYLVLQTTVLTKKATSSNQSTVALENSYLFISPLQAKADGKEKMRLTVFILDGRGMGIANQTVSLSTSSKINITSIQSQTDESGKAVFDLTSTTVGQYNVSAQTGDATIPQQVKVVFN
jgi:hypothetical protein